MRQVGDHAVIIGASMAGLLAARVLTEAYHRVTIVERDVLPACGDPRRGVPQGQHLHGLLASGFSALETLFDGFAEEMLLPARRLVTSRPTFAGTSMVTTTGGSPAACTV